MLNFSFRFSGSVCICVGLGSLLPSVLFSCNRHLQRAYGMVSSQEAAPDTPGSNEPGSNPRATAGHT